MPDNSCPWPGPGQSQDATSIAVSPQDVPSGLPRSVPTAAADEGSRDAQQPPTASDIDHRKYLVLSEEQPASMPGSEDEAAKTAEPLIGTAPPPAAGAGNIIGELQTPTPLSLESRFPIGSGERTAEWINSSSVWVTGQVCSRDQRKGRYVPASIYHPGKMLPSIARHAIAKYTSPGDIVADPMCGIGTTLVEAMHADRIGIGVEYENKWAELANANIELAASQGAPGTAQIWCGDGRDIGQFAPPSVRGKVALVITSPPYGPSTHGRAYTGNRRTGRKVLKAHHKYGENPDNLAYVEPDELAAGFTGILKECAAILRPGGIVVITARPYRQHGELVNIPGMVIAAGRAAGLAPIDRCVALLCGVRDGRLVPRGSFFQIQNARHAAGQGSAPLHVVQHEDLVVLELGPAGRASR